MKSGIQPANPNHRNRSLGFSGARDLKAFARMRRFEHSFRVAPGLDDALLKAMRDASGWEPHVGVDFATCRDGSPVPPAKHSWKKKTPAGGSGSGNGSRDRRGSQGGGGVDEEMMSMMDAMMMDSRGGGESSITSRDEEVAARSEKDGSGEEEKEEEEEEEEEEDDEAEYSGRPTRNDNANALNGVEAYYAMPQEVMPVFFEPAPTAAMIAAKKSFMHRQGWQMATIGGGRGSS